MRLFRSFRDDRALLRKSAEFVSVLMAEPAPSEVEWLGEPQVGRDRLEQLVDGAGADRREHLANILVGVGREVHERQSTAVPRTDPSST